VGLTAPARGLGSARGGHGGGPTACLLLLVEHKTDGAEVVSEEVAELAGVEGLAVVVQVGVTLVLHGGAVNPKAAGGRRVSGVVTVVYSVVVDGAIDALDVGFHAVLAVGERLAPDLEVAVTQGRAVQAKRSGRQDEEDGER